jgi:plastocyanin
MIKLHRTFVLTAGLLLSSLNIQAATIKVNDDRFVVSESVAFSIGNAGASNFLFNWSDNGDIFTDESDVTLLLTLGQTYTFQRTSSSHPFAIMDSTAADFITGSDGGFTRTSTSSSDISDATLKPIADFTANPGPTSDPISWTPTAVGDYYYTCTVTNHMGMTGKIVVVPEPSTSILLSLGVFGVLYRRR